MNSNFNHQQPKEIEEEFQLIQSAQNEPRSFEPLYDKYYERIFRFIFRRTDDESLTADICSQTFLKAMQNIKKYKFKGVPFSAWLFRIASNEVYQYYRKKKKDRTIYIDEGNIKPFFSELVYESEDTYDNESNENLLQKLVHLLKDKALKDIELIEMRFFENRAFKEIGDILNITENNAKVRVYRALDKLRESLIPQMKSI